MFNWSKFDHIYCIHYLPYTNRLIKMQKVLQKLGILNLSNFEWYYTTDNKIFNDLYNLMAEKKLISNNTEKTSFSSITKQPIEGYIQNNNVFNLAINIVNLLQQAYLLKYDRILILEDDLVPLANNQLLNLYLNNYPENFDIVSMEYWFRNENDFFSVIDSNRKINEYFYLVSNERIVNFSCVGLSRNGIKHILDGMNQKFVASDMYIANQHMYDDWQIKRAISRIPLFIQDSNIQSNHSANSNAINWKYSKIFLNTNQYKI